MEPSASKQTEGTLHDANGRRKDEAAGQWMPLYAHAREVGPKRPAGNGGHPTSGDTMKPSTKDQAAGTLHEVKGVLKEQVGKLILDPQLEGAGKDEKHAGQLQQKIGQVENLLGE